VILAVLHRGASSPCCGSVAAAPPCPLHRRAGPRCVPYPTPHGIERTRDAPVRRRESPGSDGPGAVLVGDTGIEPVTSSVSGKRATAAPIARGDEVEMGFEPTYTALQAAASPLGHSTLRPRDDRCVLGCVPPSGRRDSN